MVLLLVHKTPSLALRNLSLEGEIKKWTHDYTRKVTLQEEIKGKTETTSLEIIYDELTHKFENMDGKSVLDTALQNNLEVPYSCQGGVCSSCIARIKSSKEWSRCLGLILMLVLG